MILGRKNYQTVQHKYNSTYLIFLGLITGLLTDMVGAGGGFLIIPILVHFTEINFKTAVGTTLLIITANSLFGFMGDLINYPINWIFLFFITLLSIFGIILGLKITKSVSRAEAEKNIWLVCVTHG